MICFKIYAEQHVSKYMNSDMKPLPLRENASKLLKCSVRRNKMSPHSSTILLFSYQPSVVVGMFSIVTHAAYIFNESPVFEVRRFDFENICKQNICEINVER